MKQKILMIGAACFVAALAWGCSGENGSVADEASDAAGKVADSAKDAVGEMGDGAKDAVDKAGNAAGDMMGALKSEWTKQLDGFDKRLTGIKASASKLNNAELNGYVETIETKLGEAKEVVSSIASGDVDMAKVKETVTTKMSELGGLFQAAEDKAKSLMGGGH